MITLGILIAYIVDYGTKDINGAAAYKIPIGLQCIWGAILCASFNHSLFTLSSPDPVT